MNVNIYDRVNNTRNIGNTKTNLNETPEKADESTPSLTFSSERFNFSTFAEDASIDCINKVGSLFAEFKKKPPTLKEALMSMGYGEKSEELLGIFTDKASRKLDELEAPGLNVEDVAAIFCYTYEWDEEKFGNDVDSPYRKLNKSLSVDRRNPVLKKTRAFLFLLLQALRKLPRYTPENRTLYRGINIHVQTEVNPEHPDRKPHAKGYEKTWWAFTSTTEDLEITKDFVRRNEGTLFTLSGEAWGYDISVFSNFPNEKEVLLEPERRLSIKGVKKEGAIIAVNAEILDAPLVLKDYIKAKPVKIKERNSKNKEVPRNLRVENITESTVTLSWDAPEVNGGEVLSYQVSARQTSDKLYNRNSENTYIMKKDETRYTVRSLEEGKEYEFRVRCKYGDGWSQKWSEKINARVRWKYSWRECPDDADDTRKYSVDEKDSRIATKTNNFSCCIIIGNMPIPLNKVTSWSIKILKSKDNDGNDIYIGAAPNNINQSNDNCGWYFNCWSSKLYSGPPHNYNDKEYGPRKEIGLYVHIGDSVGVVVDTTKGELSFVLNGVNYGVAYEGIPLDKPLVPCVILWYQGDSVELVPSKVKENMDSSIPVPSNTTTKSITWNSITIIWDEVSDASFYQIEADESISCDIATTNAFTKRGFLPETEHSFRVRAVRGSSVGVWSSVVKGRTLKESFTTSGWEECPAIVDYNRKYTVDEENPRTAAKINHNDYCTIIGNTPIPLNTVTSWSIKVLKSKNSGDGICIGVAPSDINPNENNHNRCGWYFYCFDSKLYSGLPHNYRNKEYGQRRGKGEYVHTGDSVGVMVDTTMGELSFALNGVNLGVAYEGIPLDKPLVPCVLLYCEGDSVELDPSEVKENVDSSVPVPSNIIAKSTTWDTITLTWDEVADASFYQIEVDGNKSWDTSSTSSFTKRELLPDTEHSFRVLTVRGSSVSEWSGVVKGKTPKWRCAWVGYSNGAYGLFRHIVNANNPRIATKITSGNSWCTIIGDTLIPLNTVTSWSIKIHKSGFNYEDGIYIGVAPSGINRNVDLNRNNCGWYFDCDDSTLMSGPPHNYSRKKYGPRKGWGGQYVHTGDSVGVMMDTIKGELSFILNGVNLGVAYDGIPLDKPLVPCVALQRKGDSVEIDVSEVKEDEVNSSVPVPSNITAKSTTWDTTTLTWDKVIGASFYQIEVDGNKSWDASTKNAFTKRGFLPETEHSFRVRAVRGSLVSEWSGVVKGRTPKESFETSAWKECFDCVDWDKKYSVDDNNTRIASKINNDGCCTIIGNTFIPPNTMASWGVKVLVSRYNNSFGIYVGVAPFYIDQNASNYNYCGWYFHCYHSTLRSGPPHSYRGQVYGPRKGDGQYLHTGNFVGVVMDTTNSELSFFLDGVNLGVAYKWIPLDMPLVPCVILGYYGDSVELVV